MASSPSSPSVLQPRLVIGNSMVRGSDRGDAFAARLSSLEAAMQAQKQIADANAKRVGDLESENACLCKEVSRLKEGMGDMVDTILDNLDRAIDGCHSAVKHVEKGVAEISVDIAKLWDQNKRIIQRSEDVFAQVKVHSESMHGLHEDQQKLKDYIDEEDQLFVELVNSKQEAFRKEWHNFQNNNKMLVSEAKASLCGIIQQQSEQKTAQNIGNILAEQQFDILQTTLKRHQNLLAAGSERLAMLEQFGDSHVRLPADSMVGVDDAISTSESLIPPTTTTQTARHIGLPTQIEISPIVARVQFMHADGAQVLSSPECLIEIDIINPPLTIQPRLEVDEQGVEQEPLP